MTKSSTLLSLLLLVLLGVGSAYASSVSSPCACASQMTNGAPPIDLGLTFFPSAGKLYGAISGRINWKAVDAEGQVITPATGSSVAKCRCDQPTPEIMFDYKSFLSDISPSLDSFAGSYKMTDGDQKWLGLISVRGKFVGNLVCLQAMLPPFGWTNVYCKNRPTTADYSQPSQNCMVALSCSQNADSASRNLLPITAKAMQCVDDTLYQLFFNSSSCSGNAPSMFVAFQNNMRRAVGAALVLYVILFGIKLTLGSDMPKRQDWSLFMLKMVLVIYFSVGFPATNTQTNGVSTTSAVAYKDGLRDLVLPMFYKGANTLANIMFQAANQNGLCQYKISDYPVSAEEDYRYMALWDSLDCRVLYYLGVINPNIAIGAATEGAAVAIASMIAPPMVIYMIMPAILSGAIVFAFFSLIFGILVTSITIFFIHFFIIAKIALTVVIYIGPLFVPMALFKATKSYFDGWLKSLISYALQPTIVAAFMALMYSIFDNVLYGTCQFSRSTLNPMIFNRSIDIFSLSSTAGGDPNCTNSFGYLIGGITASNGIGSKMMLFFQIPQLSSWVVAAVYWQLIIGLIFAFLFYYFAMSVEQFASSLTGGAKLGLATSPGKFADAAYNKMTNMAVGMMSDKGGGGKGGDGLTASTTRGGGASGAADAKNAPVGGGDANG